MINIKLIHDKTQSNEQAVILPHLSNLIIQDVFIQNSMSTTSQINRVVKQF